MTDSGEGPVFDFPLEDDIAALVDAIRISGARDPMVLALQGVEAFIQLSHKYHLTRPLEINVDIRGLCRALVQARPECAPVVNLANDMLRPLETFYGRAEGEPMRADLRERAETWREALLEGEGQRILRAAQLIKPRSRVICSGYSADLAGALRQAWAADLDFKAICVMDPAEGASGLADDLARHEIPTTVIEPRDLKSHLKKDALMFLEAEGVSTEGIYHRAGTGVLGKAARARKVPVYALAGPEKFFPFGYLYPAAALSGQSSQLEVTPLDILSGLVTNHALLSGETLTRALEQHAMQPLLIV